MTNQLAFKNHTFDIVYKNKKLWIKSSQLSAALGFDRADAANHVYLNYSDEFTPSMTTLANQEGVNEEFLAFSLQGAYLIAMRAETSEAKNFRRWVIDIIERENTRLSKLQYNHIRDDYDQYILNEAEWAGVKLQPKQKVLDAINTLRLHYQAVDTIIGSVHNPDLVDFSPKNRLNFSSPKPLSAPAKGLAKRITDFLRDTPDNKGRTLAVIANRLRVDKSYIIDIVKELVNSCIIKECNESHAYNNSEVTKYKIVDAR